MGDKTMKILELNVDVKVKDSGLRIKYSGGFGTAISTMLSNEQKECLDKHIEDIIEIVSEALETDMLKHVKEEIEEMIEKVHECLEEI